jgi:two-component system chemotaxis response regulator CheY
MFPADTRFLIVDDTKTIRSLLKEILKNIGYKKIDEAEDGSQALDMMKREAQSDKPYGFIICDWNMPGLTGIELLEVRNSDLRFQKVPFLMVTIESEREYVLKAVAMGVSDFVVKPFSEATVRSKMESIWNRLK